MMEIVCKIFGHKPAYIRANFREQQNYPPEERTYKVEFGCARCMKSLDHDDYEKEDIINYKRGK